MNELRETKFGELRRMISAIDRVSICMLETSQYENYLDIKDVPEKFNEMYVFGIGSTDSEFPEDENLHFMPCLEIVLSEKTRAENEARNRFERKNKLMDRLAEKFPFMRDENNNPMYCDIELGWFPLVEKLCQEITDAYNTAELPMDICVEQVKEKWGELRFYFYFVNRKSTTDTADKVKQLHCKIVEIVDRYEDKSSTVCEECGQPGELRDERGYIHSLCDDCFEKKKE